jgi:molecular chaperone HscB
LNDAYRTLKNAVARVEYLLSVEGLGAKSPEEASKHVPPALLEEVFALNEELDEVREMRASGAPAEEWRARLERARGPIDAKRQEHERQLEELSAHWDELAGRAASAPVAPGANDRREVLHALQDRVLERNYINNLLAGIERELSQ